MSSDNTDASAVDDDPFRTATYLRGLRNGMEEAAKICDECAARYRRNGTTVGPIMASGADSAAFYIRKEAAKVKP